ATLGLAHARSGEHALSRTGRWQGGYRTGAGLRAGARAQHPHSRTRSLLGRHEHQPLAGPLRRAVGRAGRGRPSPPAPRHRYGAVGAGRGMAADSSDGSELYVVTGQSPRQLDRNITLVGRVVDGMELLSVLPRGTGPLGFYEDAAQRVPIEAIRLAADVPEAD